MPLLESTSNWQKNSCLWNHWLSTRLIYYDWRTFTYQAELTIWFHKSATRTVSSEHTVLPTCWWLASWWADIWQNALNSKTVLTGREHTESHTADLSCTWACLSALTSIHHQCCTGVNICSLKNSDKAHCFCRVNILKGQSWNLQSTLEPWCVL